MSSPMWCEEARGKGREQREGAVATGTRRVQRKEKSRPSLSIVGDKKENALKCRAVLKPVCHLPRLQSLRRIRTRLFFPRQPSIRRKKDPRRGSIAIGEKEKEKSNKTKHAQKDFVVEPAKGALVWILCARPVEWEAVGRI